LETWPPTNAINDLDTVNKGRIYEHQMLTKPKIRIVVGNYTDG